MTIPSLATLNAAEIALRNPRLGYPTRCDMSGGPAAPSISSVLNNVEIIMCRLRTQSILGGARLEKFKKPDSPVDLTAAGSTFKPMRIQCNLTSRRLSETHDWHDCRL